MSEVESGLSAGPVCLRIVVLDAQAGLWCEACAELLATAITYLVEVGGTALARWCPGSFTAVPATANRGSSCSWSTRLPDAPW